MVLIHIEPPRRGQPLYNGEFILFPKCPLFGGLTVFTLLKLFSITSDIRPYIQIEMWDGAGYDQSNEVMEQPRGDNGWEEDWEEQTLFKLYIL